MAAFTRTNHQRQRPARSTAILDPKQIPSQIPRLLLLTTLLVAINCDRHDASSNSGSPTAATSQPNVEWVDPKTVQRGPIQRDELTPAQMARIRTLQATFAEVQDATVDQWADDFKRDLDPDSELNTWETMAKAYTAYCSKRSLTLGVKKEVFKVVLLRSMASEQDVFQHLELKFLSKADATEVMRGF